MTSFGQKLHGAPSDVIGTRVAWEEPPPQVRRVRFCQSAVQQRQSLCPKPSREVSHTVFLLESVILP